MVKFPSAMDYVPEGLHGSLGFDWIEAVEDQCVAWSWIESNISRGEKKKTQPMREIQLAWGIYVSCVSS